MQPRTKGKRAIFVDRDGTLIEEVNFLSKVEDLRFFSFTSEALTLLRDAGFTIVVITNQSGIGRGLYSSDDMDSIHSEIQREYDGAIAAFYHCPHLPNAGCRCRKPDTGSIEQAIDQLGVTLEGSWMVGDKRSDIETGFAAGMRTALVLTGYGKDHRALLDREPDVVSEDLLAAARAIIDLDRAAPPSTEARP